jgi:tight adherence protein C
MLVDTSIGGGHMVFLIVFLTSASVMLFVLGLSMKSGREITMERIEQHSSTIETQSSVKAELNLPFRERVLMPALRKLADYGMHLVPGRALQDIDTKLESAGRPWHLGGVEFVGLRVASIAVSVVLAFLAAGIIANPVYKIFTMAVFILTGFFAPGILLQQAVDRRHAAIRKVLPDTLDLLTVSVEAGLGLDAAIQRVVEKMDNPLSHELDHALQEMQLGKLRVDALRSMAQRVGVSELSAFVAALAQAEQLGVSISGVLENQSRSLRNTRGQWVRELAAKMPIKMLVPLVFFIFPTIFVVLLAPGIIQIAKAFGIMK